MVEIKAGAELDRAVAEAIANFGTVHPDGVFSPALPIPFRPSVDLNAAFDASEAVGLFDVHWLGKLQTGWVVHEMDTGPISECETASLAICAAILELAKGNDS